MTSQGANYFEKEGAVRAPTYKEDEAREGRKGHSLNCVKTEGKAFAYFQHRLDESFH